MGWEWFAGLFEGEGHIAFTGKFSVMLRINMTDEDVLHKAQKVAGGTVVGPYAREGNRKDVWSWSLTRSDAVLAVLDGIEPFLGSRRQKRVSEARERLMSVRRNGHCKRGHPMNGDNLYVSPKGQRHCRACAADREARKRIIKT